MFQIMFKSGHALPLPGGRFSWPRIGRGGGAERLRNRHCSWPQTRPGDGHEPVQFRPRTQTVRVREQSVNTDWQWIQSSMTAPRQRSWIVRSQSTVVDFP